METPPANSEPEQASVGNVVDGLPLRSCQAELSGLVSSSSRFDPSSDLIRLQSSIPNSPFRFAENHSVSFSQSEGTAVAQFVSNSDVISSYLSSQLFVQPPLDVLSKKYCRKRKRLKSEAEQFPTLKKRSPIDVKSFSGKTFSIDSLSSSFASI